MILSEDPSRDGPALGSNCYSDPRAGSCPHALPVGAKVMVDALRIRPLVQVVLCRPCGDEACKGGGEVLALGCDAVVVAGSYGEGRGPIAVALQKTLWAGATPYPIAFATVEPTAGNDHRDSTPKPTG